MTWTHEKPTRPGFYWVKHMIGKRLVQWVWFAVYDCDTGEEYWNDDISLWYGPLEPPPVPEEPK